MDTATIPIDSTTVTAERAALWRPTGMPTAWHLEVQAQVQIAATSLALDVEIITMAERTVERWRLLFEGFVALKIDPVGDLGNPPLTHFLPEYLSPLYAPPPDALWEIDHSDWLPTLISNQLVPGRLHHLVVFETTRKRAWHIAAMVSSAARHETGQIETPSRLMLVEAAMQTARSCMT